MRGRVLTGHRPTGPRHLGHLVGTLHNWTHLQETHECFFLVADYHVLTTDYAHSDRIAANILATVSDWLAAGLDPLRSTFVLQSWVPEHTELSALFSMLVSVARLARSPTYKEQVKELHLEPSLGLLAYPVLQAADILAYRADTVPVGDDQMPHIEVTRDLARRFNALYGSIFPEPRGLLSEMPRLPGLDGRTMHNSYGNTIPLSAPAGEVAARIRRMITDPGRVHSHDPGTPQVCAAFAYYSAFLPGLADSVAGECRSAAIGCVPCKERLAQALVQKLTHFRAKRQELESRPEVIWEILREGSSRARLVASETLVAAKKAMRLAYGTYAT